jgi:hypothetical protein
MAYSVAYQHTDSNRNHDGCDLVHGVKEMGTDRKLLVPYSIIFGTSHKKSLAKLCRMTSFKWNRYLTGNTVPYPCDSLFNDDFSPRIWNFRLFFLILPTKRISYDAREQDKTISD